MANHGPWFASVLLPRRMDRADCCSKKVSSDVWLIARPLLNHTQEIWPDAVQVTVSEADEAVVFGLVTIRGDQDWIPSGMENALLFHLQRHEPTPWHKPSNEMSAKPSI